MCRQIDKGGRRCNGGEGGKARRRVQYAAANALVMLESGQESRFLKHVHTILTQSRVMAEHGVSHVPLVIPSEHVVAAARIVASDAHQGQFRRDGRPYIVHPAAVAERLERAGLPPHVVAAGWLHDTVEDTDLTLDDLRRIGFEERIVSTVALLTHEEGESYSEMTVPRAVTTLDSAAVKDADNQHNTSDRRGPTPDQFAKQEARNRKYLDARRQIKARLYETEEGQRLLQEEFAAMAARESSSSTI